MNCPNCNSEIENNWKYCASCGANITIDTESDTIMNYSTRDRTMAKNSSSREFKDEELVERMAKEIGVSILASLGGVQTRGMEIRVINPRNHALRQAFPDKPENREYQNRQSCAFRQETGFKAQEKGHAIECTRKQEAASKPVFEPKIDITRLPGKIAVDAELPEVVSSNNVSTTLLGESMEIRAIAPEKMYFKIVPVPRRMRIIRSAFLEGKLRVELGEFQRR